MLSFGTKQPVVSACAIHPHCRPREGGDPVTSDSSAPSCPRTRAYVDIALAVAVVSGNGTAEAFLAPVSPHRRAREGEDAVTVASSVPSCPRMRASMDVAFAVAVVRGKTAANAFVRRPPALVVPAKAGTQCLSPLQHRHARERGHPWALPSLLFLLPARLQYEASCAPRGKR